jgi:response regulator RpfG family c-di-GMP phosphodiesterase
MPQIKTEENTVVLVMDRGSEDVKLVTSLLKKTGFQVIQSTNRAEIVNLCRDSGGLVPLVIVDTAAPGIHMSELLNEVQAADPQIRILLISGQNESEPIRHWSVSGNVRGHLSRPFRRAQFLGSVLEAAKEPLVRTA